jgi:hypothetical protein
MVDHKKKFLELYDISHINNIYKIRNMAKLGRLQIQIQTMFIYNNIQTNIDLEYLHWWMIAWRGG